MSEQEFLQELREYIESAELQIEGEWGGCRSLQQLISAGEMPPIYLQVLKRLAALK